jgi:acetylglutamate synthase
MAINKNHEFEELDGVKCGIVEKNVLPERVAFLKKLLEYNKFTVVIVPSPPPKVAAVPIAIGAAKIAEGEEAPPVVEPAPVIALETFTVGVTDYTYNTINAIYGRLLKTPDGHVVTMAYWQQKENVSHDEIPYYEDMV